MVACAAITILCFKQVSHFLFPTCSTRDKVLHAVLLLLVVTLALKNKQGQVLAWKSGLKVSLLPLGLSFTLQAILLSDLVGCESPLQIEMAVWRAFLKFKAR